MNVTRALRTLIPLAALSVMALAAASPAAGHQCVDVEIIRAPAQAQVGEVFTTADAVGNCGGPARGFLITWTLVREEGDRVILRRAVAKVRPGEVIDGRVRLMIPADTEPGVYRLVMTGKAPSGFTDRDSRRIRVRPAD